MASHTPDSIHVKGGAIGGLRQYTAVKDPIQARWIAVTQMIRELQKERAALKEKLQTGSCEICGSLFKRSTTRKRFCSQQCVSRNYAQQHHARYDIDLVKEMLPVLAASSQLSDRNLDIVRMVVLDGVRPSECADREGLTRERVGQILGRATSLARMMKAIRSVEVK